MTALRAVLASFDPPEPVAEAAADPAAIAAARAEGHAAGHARGVAETESRLRDVRHRRDAEVARHLQAMHFAHREARAHFRSQFAGLIDGLCDRLLPAMAREGLAPIVRDILMTAATPALDAPLELALHPDARPVVEAYLAAGSAPPVCLVDDPALGLGQVILRDRAGEQLIDIDRITDAVCTALRARMAHDEERSSHG